MDVTDGRFAKIKSRPGGIKRWFDGDVRLRFLLANSTNSNPMSDRFFELFRTPDLAPSLVARNAFMSHPSRWYYVELVKDEFESIETEES